MADNDTPAEPVSDLPPEGLKALSPEETRRRAAALAALELHPATEALTAEEAAAQFHELRVHQIQLEMQNEELRTIQEALEASRTRYFDLYDLAPVGYLTLDEQGVIVEANLTAANLLGVGRSALAHKPLRRFILREDQDVHYLHQKQLAETGARQSCELRMVRGDTEVFWARLEAVTGHDADGDPVSRVAVLDVSEHKRLEVVVADSEEQFRTVFEYAAVGISLTAPDATLLRVNPALAETLGRTVDQLVGSNMAGVTHPDDVALTRELMRGLLDGESDVARFEKRYLRPDGEVVWGAVSSYLVRHADGTPRHFITHIQDITERKSLESQLHQAQKMESIGRLAGGVAHDFNNMLTVILGQAQVLLMRAPASDPAREGLVQIEKTARRSAQLTQQLLAFARKQTISPKVLDLNETLEAMLSMLRRLIGEDIDLAWLPESGLWPINMDPSQIDSVLANLCVNARDAIGDVGKVTIETSKQTLDAAYCAEHVGATPGDYVMLAVSDDGCGMDKETLDYIFEPFFTTKGLHEGTGLGLAMVYGIVKQNNGFLNVYSEPGHGTTFTLYLPRHAGELPLAATDTAATIQKGRGERILLVEDDPAILELGQMMLEGLGYQVLAAGTAADAVRLAAKHCDEIHLLLSDVVMPDMNGRELSANLHVFCPKLKTLFMSGYTADAITHRGVLEAGVNFIQKPFSVHDLAAKVRAVLDQG